MKFGKSTDKKNDKKNEQTDNAYDIHMQENSGDYQVSENKTASFVAKILAVVAAFAIWFYAMSVESPTFTMEFTGISVQIENVEATNLSVISGLGNTVSVKVQGKRSEINRLTAADIHAYVDASEIQSAGRYTLPVDITLPNGVQLQEKTPNTISVYMDNTTSMTVPVSVKVTGYKIDDGYELGEAVPNVSEIIVTGPQAVLENIESARATLDLGHMTNSVNVLENLTLVNANGEAITNPYVRMQTTEVEVTVPLYLYKEVPVEVEYKYGYYNDETVDITITPSVLRIRGEPSVIEGYDRILLMTLNEKTTTTDTITQAINLPENVMNVNGITSAEIRIRHIGTETKTIVVENIEVNNPKHFNYELLSDSINVTLRGPASYLAYVTPSNVSAVVDLEYLNSASGTTSVVAAINITTAFNKYVYEVGDYKISVRIY